MAAGLGKASDPTRLAMGEPVREHRLSGCGADALGAPPRLLNHEVAELAPVAVVIVLLAEGQLDDAVAAIRRGHAGGGALADAVGCVLTAQVREEAVRA